MQALVHQIFYNENTRSMLMPGFVPLDNTLNERPDWFEFWVILQFLRKNNLRDDTWYGFLSPRFQEKTGYSSEQILNTLNSSPQETDVFLFSQAWDQICYFQNPWEQGEAWHPGITELSQEVITRYGIQVQLTDLVTDMSCSVFSNYVIANKRFWMNWYGLAECFYQFVESETGKQTAMNRDTSYGIETNRYPMKTFIQERFASLLIALGNYQVVFVDASQSSPMFERLFGSNPQTRRGLQVCDWMKQKYRQTGVSSYLHMYRQIRSEIPYHPPMMVRP